MRVQPLHRDIFRYPSHKPASPLSQAFADVKAYYKDITANNLDLIRQQREELAAARLGEAAANGEAARLAADNRRLAAPRDEVRCC